MFYNISIIGLGGIGSVLSNTISRYMSSKDIYPFITINLVDGDEYEHKNIIRQEFEGFGNKSLMKLLELNRKFKNINFNNFSVFVKEDNIDTIIEENSLVFLCVDNHKTRKLVSDYAGSLKDITIISGGNELTDGNVQIYIRKGGENITPSLTDYHPEIDNPTDKRPDEMSCEELSLSAPQLYFTNFMVAAYMCAAVYNIEKGNNSVSNSEVYFDLITMNASSKKRLPKNQTKK